MTCVLAMGNGELEALVSHRHLASDNVWFSVARSIQAMQDVYRKLAASVVNAAVDLRNQIRLDLESDRLQ